MISIVFAVPYPSMRDLVYEVFENHPLRDKIKRDIHVIQAEYLDIKELQGSVIVARGLTYARIRKQDPAFPCVEVDIHTGDIMRSLIKCKNTHNPRHIALIGDFQHLTEPEMFFRLLGCEVTQYTQDNIQTLSAQIRRAMDDGCDAFVGGYSMCKWCEDRSYPAVLVESTREEVRHALDEAIRTYFIMQKNAVANIALERVKEAVVYVDEAGGIGYVNPGAQELFDAIGTGEPAIGRPLSELLPFMSAMFEKMRRAGGPMEDELHSHNGVQLAVSCLPVFVGNALGGAVVNLATVESIRKQEYSIREKLSRRGLKARYSFRDIIHRDNRMEKVLAEAKKCARVSSNLLLVGETGVGKELFAHSIHNHSDRRDGPFVAINCGALPEHLIESELFGYSEGAFTGALKGGKPGLMETAHGGTLFLDEVSELPYTVQSKLLRALQEREVRRIGDDKVIIVDVRIISASNKSLADAVRQGKFRQDLLYRLDILSLHIPPLRERSDDIVELFWHYVGQYNDRIGSVIRRLSPSAERLLVAHPFEGNGRELRNLVERLCVLSGGETVDHAEMARCLFRGDVSGPDAPGGARPLGAAASDGEAKSIVAALERSGFNRTRAARLLGVDRSTLWRKMRRYGIAAPAVADGGDDA